jgi:carboxyl-terminal processing protease
LVRSEREGTVIVRAAPPGLAAARAGLEPGDELLLIDGRDVRAMSSDQVHAALEGEIGSTVRLTVLRRGEIARLAVERGPLRRE